MIYQELFWIIFDMFLKKKDNSNKTMLETEHKFVCVLYSWGVQ